MEAEFAALGVPFRERGRRMDEGIAMMRAVWSEDPVSFPARHIPAVIEEMRMLPQPVKPIPIWIGGSSEPALARAVRLRRLARLAPSPEEAAPVVKRLREERPEPEFAISLRYGWDGKDDGVLRDRLQGYREVGVGHVLVEPVERETRRLARAVDEIAKAGEGMLDMKLAITLKFSPGHAGIDMDLVWEAERLGFEAVWCGEAYGTDAVSPVAWVLAHTSRIKAGTSIMQMPARTPACAAMTAMTLQALSGNRFLCGIGPSGPQVIEGWHGVPFGKPLARTREYIAIIRQILRAQGAARTPRRALPNPLYRAGLRPGSAKPLRSIIHGDPEPEDLHRVGRAGRAAHGRRGGRRRAAVLHVAGKGRGDRRAGAGGERQGRQAARPRRFRHRALCAGRDGRRSRGMPRRDPARHSPSTSAAWGRDRSNFYNDLAKRLGYEAAAGEIQDHFLAGRRDEAEAAVPDELIDEISLIGPKERIRDRLQAWQEIAKRGWVGSLVLVGATPRRCASSPKRCFSPLCSVNSIFDIFSAQQYENVIYESAYL